MSSGLSVNHNFNFKSQVYLKSIKYLSNVVNLYVNQHLLDDLRNFIIEVNFAAREFRVCFQKKSMSMLVEIVCTMFLRKLHRKISEEKRYKSTLVEADKVRNLGNLGNVSEVGNLGNVSNASDIHSLIRKEILINEAKGPGETKNISINTILGVESFEQLAKEIFPQLLLKKAYIVLDSKYRENSDSFTIDGYKYKWTMTRDLNTRTGFICCTKNIQNVVSMKILQPVIPKCYTFTSNYVICLLIDELSNEAMYDGSNKYHFMLGDTKDDQIYSYDFNTESYNRGEFKFTNPVRKLDTITLRLITGGTTSSVVVVDSMIPAFGSPYSTTVSWGNNDRLDLIATHGSPTTFTTVGSVNHNLDDGDYISISNFDATDTKLDANAINTINNNQLAVTVLSASSFSVNVDSNAGNEKSNLVVKAYVEKYRLLIPMEITYRPDEST